MTFNDVIRAEDYADFLLLNTAAEVNSVLDGADCVQPLGTEFRAEYIALEELYRGQPGGGDPFLLLAGSELRKVDYYSLPKLYGLMDRGSLDRSRITEVQNQPRLSLTGSGVLIGFVDTGIDWRLPVFQKRTGRTRIAALWDQAGEGERQPEGFLYGREYKAEEINQALEGAGEVPLDEDGHGTFLAALAAGGEDIAADFIGAAPSADIAVVKLKQAKQYLRAYFEVSEDVNAYQENDIMAGILYLHRLALRRRQPLVLCLGLGTNQGPHNGTGPLEEVLTEIGRLPQRVVCVAAGNEGGQGSHYYGRLNRLDSTDIAELRVDAQDRGFTVEFWAEGTELYQITVQSPTGERVPRFGGRGGSSRIWNFVFEETTIVADYELVEELSGTFGVQLRFRDPTPGIWRIQVSSVLFEDSSFHMWLPVKPFLQGNTAFLRPNPDTTVTDPANPPRVITVGGYEHRDGSLYLDSGRGYSSVGAVKPSLVAPAVEIYGPEPGGLYGYRDGTSLAAAQTAGAAALLLEWGVIRGNAVNMNTVEALTYLIRGAKRIPGREYPNREWGYGQLDLYRTFEVLTTI